jgi:hypothetical protein
MRTSHPEGRTPTFRQFVLVMAAVTWFAVLLPVGARAAGQLVTIVDPTTSDKARVGSNGALQVAEYNDPARQPFTKAVSTSMLQGQNGVSATVTSVPAGTRLVIDTVSVRVRLLSGQRALRVSVQASGAPFYIPITFTGTDTFFGQDQYQALFPVQLYAGPLTNVTVTFWRNATVSSAFADFSISGHFVTL